MNYLNVSLSWMCFTTIYTDSLSIDYNCQRFPWWPLFIYKINIRLEQSKRTVKRFRWGSVGGHIKRSTHFSEYNYIQGCMCVSAVQERRWEKKGKHSQEKKQWRMKMLYHWKPKGHVGVSVHYLLRHRHSKLCSQAHDWDENVQRPRRGF